MTELPTPFPLRDLFDAAVRQRSVRLTCKRCSHETVYASAALWWLFEKKGWQDRLRDVPRRFYCRLCQMRYGQRVRMPKLELVSDPPTATDLPLPSELDWKRELRRRR